MGERGDSPPLHLKYKLTKGFLMQSGAQIVIKHVHIVYLQCIYSLPCSPYTCVLPSCILTRCVYSHMTASYFQHVPPPHLPTTSPSATQPESFDSALSLQMSHHQGHPSHCHQNSQRLRRTLPSTWGGQVHDACHMASASCTAGGTTAHGPVQHPQCDPPAPVPGAAWG